MTVCPLLITRALEDEGTAWTTTTTTRTTRIPGKQCARPELIALTDARRIGEDADRARRRGAGCHSHYSFTLLSLLLLLVIYSHVSPSQAKPFSLVGTTADGIIVPNRLTTKSDEGTRTSPQLLANAHPKSFAQFQQRLEELAYHERRKLFAEKIYPREQKDFTYSYAADAPAAPIDTLFLPQKAPEHEDVKLEKKNSGEVTETSLTDEDPKNDDYPDGSGLLVGTESPVTAGNPEEVAPTSDSLKTKDGTDRVPKADVLAPLPIHFQANPFVFSPGVSPEIHEQLFPSKQRPLPSLLDELGSIL